MSGSRKVPAASAGRSRSLGQPAAYLGLIAVTLVIGLPLFWMATGSIKTLREIYTFPPVWVPPAPAWQNYVAAWNAAPFGRLYLNSVLVAVIATALKLIFAIASAYALAFVRSRLRQIAFVIVLAALMIPEQATVLTNYLTVGELGWINTYQGLILPHASVALGTFLLRQHFLVLPRDILEAARLDGVGDWGLLRWIILPLSTPVLATVVMISLVSLWNEFLWTRVVTNSTDVRTLPVGIAFLFEQEGTTQWGIVMAATMFVVLPMILVFVWAQRYIVAGLTAGATKG